MMSDPYIIYLCHNSPIIHHPSPINLQAFHNVCNIIKVIAVDILQILSNQVGYSLF